MYKITDEQSKRLEAQKAFQEICRIHSQAPSPFKGMTVQQIVKRMRKTREELWREKIADRS